MHWPQSSSEGSESAEQMDYVSPSHYQHSPCSQQPVQSLTSVPHNSSTMMDEYHGPVGVEGYTADVGADQREASARGTAQGKSKRKGLAGLGGIGAALAALLLKAKALLLLLLNLKWIAFVAKFGWAGISALFSIAIYSLIFGWYFAIGLVALLFIHEMGHAVVMKLKGIPVGGLIFIPMLGAAVFMRQMPKNARDEAEVGIAGPIAGALASSFCLLVALQSPHSNSLWAALAYFGFFMNLFNLVPIIPFDGGRVLAAIDRRVWIIGFLALLALQIWYWINGQFSIWLLFFVVMAATQLWSHRAVANTPETQAYYAVPAQERIIIALLYFGLAAVLVLGMSVAHGLIMPLSRG